MENTNFDTAMTALTAVIALSAVASLIIAVLVFREQKILRKAGTEPVILAHFRTRDDSGAAVELCFTNVGSGAAKNVRITFENDEAFFKDGKADFKLRAIHETVGTILQDKSVSFFFGRGFKLLAPPILSPFYVNFSYENIEGALFSSRQLLDVRVLSGTPAHQPIGGRIAHSLEEIQKDIRAVTNGSKHIGVVVTTAEELAKTQREAARQMHAMMEEENGK